jgi:hypothetical protein
MSKKCRPSSSQPCRMDITAQSNRRGPARATTHRESMPVLGVKQKGFGLGHRHPFPTLWSLDPHGFIAGHRQYVRVPMSFQPQAQVQIAAIHGYPRLPSRKGSLLSRDAQSSVGPAHIWYERRSPLECQPPGAVQDRRSIPWADTVHDR